MKYILGGGITGLIWAFYNEDFTVLTKDVGGQMSSNFNLGPRYLHKTQNAKKLLKSLNLPITESVIRVGYISDEGWVKNPDEDFRKKYYMKSRSIKDLSGYDSTVMNTNTKQFEIYEVDFPMMITKLVDSIDNRIILEQVRGIDLKSQHILYDNSTHYEKSYDFLVSSIPLNVFLWHAGEQKLANEYKSFGMSYTLVESSVFDLNRFDFVYDIRTNSTYHRITKCEDNLILDHFGSRELIECNNCIIDSIFVPNSQIISTQYVPSYSNVKFIGRYGTWDRKWKTETVIDEAIKFKNE